MNDTTPPENLDIFWHATDISYFPDMLYPKDKPAINAKVGIVDTGCDASHPCLNNSEIDQIDFAAFEQGGTYQDDKESQSPVDLRTAISKLNLDNRKNAPEATDLIRQLIGDFSKRDINTSHHDIENPAHRYGHHGLACAGLIAADKPVNDKNKTSVLTIDDIGFRGILPGCGLVCVSTPFGYDVKPIIRALLYCLASDVDVILLPRGIDNRALSVVPDHTDIASAYNECSEQTIQEFEALHWLLDEIAKIIPLIVASGNSGLETVEYPASPQYKDMIIVGAHNAHGELSSYTSGRGDLLTVTAPSNDDDEINYGDSKPDFEDKAVEILRKTATTYAQSDRAADRTILSLDTVSQLKPRLTDQKAYGDSLTMSADELWQNTAGPIKGYNYFGGTSAASAIVAGAVAYIQAYNKYYMKERLLVSKIHSLLKCEMNKNTGVPRLNLSRIHQELEKSISTGLPEEKVDKQQLPA